MTYLPDLDYFRPPTFPIGIFFAPPSVVNPNSYTPGINVLSGINSNLGFLGSFIYI